MSVTRKGQRLTGQLAPLMPHVRPPSLRSLRERIAERPERLPRPRRPWREACLFRSLCRSRAACRARETWTTRLLGVKVEWPPAAPRRLRRLQRVQRRRPPEEVGQSAERRWLLRADARLMESARVGTGLGEGRKVLQRRRIGRSVVGTMRWSQGATWLGALQTMRRMRTCRKSWWPRQMTCLTRTSEMT